MLPEPDYQTVVLNQYPLLGLVVSNHIYVEACLRRWLSHILPNPAALDRVNVRFYELVALCEAHSLLSTDLVAALLKVNTLRNRFSHNPAHQPDEKHVKELITSIQRVTKNQIVDAAPGDPKYVSLINAITHLAVYVNQLAEMRISPFDPSEDEAAWVDDQVDGYVSDEDGS
jgi:hypothetical protein